MKLQPTPNTIGGPGEIKAGCPSDHDIVVNNINALAVAVTVINTGLKPDCSLKVYIVDSTNNPRGKPLTLAPFTSGLLTAALKDGEIVRVSCLNGKVEQKSKEEKGKAGRSCSFEWRVDKL